MNIKTDIIYTECALEALEFYFTLFFEMCPYVAQAHLELGIPLPQPPKCLELEM